MAGTLVPMTDPAPPVLDYGGTPDQSAPPITVGTGGLLFGLAALLVHGLLTVAALGGTVEDGRRWLAGRSAFVTPRSLTAAEANAVVANLHPWAGGRSADGRPLTPAGVQALTRLLTTPGQTLVVPHPNGVRVPVTDPPLAAWQRDGTLTVSSDFYLGHYRYRRTVVTLAPTGQLLSTATEADDGWTDTLTSTDAAGVTSATVSRLRVASTGVALLATAAFAIVGVANLAATVLLLTAVAARRRRLGRGTHLLWLYARAGTVAAVVGGITFGLASAANARRPDDATGLVVGILYTVAAASYPAVKLVRLRSIAHAADDGSRQP